MMRNKQDHRRKKKKPTVETRKKYTPSLIDNYKRQSSEDKFQFLHKALNSL